ncbi:MAG TPA: CcmD family protein [Spirochaetota bacterium]|nr:CcmD family protein [Spirochaetota bacterium]
MKSGVVVFAAFGVCWAVLVGYLVFLNLKITKLEKRDGE